MRYSKQRLAIEIGCALLASGAIGLSSPVFATGNTNHSSAQPAQAQRASASTSNGSMKQSEKSKKTRSSQPTNLGTVVVTALSRKQRLEDVPIAIQVVNSKSIHMHEATNLSKMDEFVPGLVISASQPTQPHYRIRGIGSNDFGIGGAPSVGVFINGVYSGGTGASLLSFNDVKRVEVLKGPQGTLFGRNTAAGAISVITNRPQHKLEARARLRAGNYGEHYTNVMLNLPAGKDFAFRFNFFDNQSDGWVQNQFNGRHLGRNDDWGTRLSWLWDPTEDLEFWLTWNHERLNKTPRPDFGLVPLSRNRHQRAPYPADPATYLNPLHTPLYNDANGYEKRRYNNVILHVDDFTSWGKFTSITAWTRFNTTNLADFDGTDHIVTFLGEGNVEFHHDLYQELRFSGHNSLLNWVAGTSFYHSDGNQRSQVDLRTNSIDTLILNLGVPTGTPTGTLYGYFNAVLQHYHLPFTVLGDPWREEIVNTQKYKSYAAYGDIIWHLTNKLDLTTGARVTRDEKHFTWYNEPREAPELDKTIDTLQSMGLLAAFGVNPAVFRQNLIFTNAVGELVSTHNSWNDFSPRVVLSYHFNPDTMGYVSVAKGYEAGGYNSVQINSHFAPETVWNYEAGIKSVLPDAHLVVNASIYHYRYSNLQALHLQTVTPSGVPRFLVSSSDQKANGMDLAMQWQPTDALRINFIAAYINSTYAHKVTAAGVDLSGQPTGVPKLSYTVGLQYIWHIDGSQLAFNVEHAYRGKHRCNSNSQLQGTCQVSPNFMVGQSTQRTDARLDWSAPGGHWGLALYANNVFNNRYVVGVDNTATSVLGTPYATITPPRTYGMVLRLKY